MLNGFQQRKKQIEENTFQQQKLINKLAYQLNVDQSYMDNSQDVLVTDGLEFYEVSEQIKKDILLIQQKL